MATTGNKNTAIAFGGFQIRVSMRKAQGSRDLKTEMVDEAGGKVMSGARRGATAHLDKAVRLPGDLVVRLPRDELKRIEEKSKKTWEAMTVLETIDYRQVPTERICQSYWLQPSKGSAQGLYLLHRALSETDKVAVVKWIATSREKLGVIRPRWVRDASGQPILRALLLSEISFANDFADPDDDTLAINEAESMFEERDQVAHVRALESARNLVTSFARSRGDEHHIDTATDQAVDERLALFDRLCDEQLERDLTASIAADETTAEIVAISDVREEAAAA